MQLLYDADIIKCWREYIYPNVYDKYLSGRFHWMHICIKNYRPAGNTFTVKSINVYFILRRQFFQVQWPGTSIACHSKLTDLFLSVLSWQADLYATHFGQLNYCHLFMIHSLKKHSTFLNGNITLAKLEKLAEVLKYWTKGLGSILYVNYFL